MMGQTVSYPPHMRQVMDFVEAVNAGTHVLPTGKTKSLCPSIYTDEARLDAEREAILNKAPIIVGHIDDLKTAGDHFAFDYLGQPLLIVRGKDDIIRTFLNVCRHRGVRLCNAEGVTRKPSFVCPYHNWTYGLNGDLINVPLEESFENENVSSRNLAAIPCAVKGGLIFVSLDKEADLNLDSFLGNIAEDLDAFNFEGQVIFDRSVRTKKCNWKLILEAFEDNYHVIRLHKNTLGGLFLDATADIERVGDHMRSLVARSSFEEMRNKPQAAWDVRNDTTLAYFLFPNTVIIIHPDYISHLGLYPTSTDETVCIHTCLIDKTPETEKEQAHFERAFAVIDEGVFNAEDFFVCEQAQIGMRSGTNETLPLSTHEVGIQLLHDIFDEHLINYEAT